MSLSAIIAVPPAEQAPPRHVKHHSRRRWISPASSLYPALRWLYQPVKATSHIVREVHWKPRTRRIIDKYLAHGGFRGLHVGCGPFHLDGWLNSELMGYHSKADFPQDLTKPFPFPADCLDAVYSSEVVEHVNQNGARAFFRSAWRVLRCGGVLRLTTPNVEECCRVFLGLNEQASVERFRKTWLDGPFSPEIWINAQFRAYGHQHLYSFDSLSAELRDAGFRRVVRCQPMQSPSDLQQLNQLETRYGPRPESWLFARTLIVEATK